MKKNIFKNKNILVAGGTGMVGQQLVPKLIKLGAKVYVSSLDNKSLVKENVINFFKLDLVKLDNCLRVTKNMDIVFNLLGVTGSPRTSIERPASFMMSNLYCAVNLLYAAQKNNVRKYLYTSTYGVYGKNKNMKEENVWKTFPSEHDKYAGWAKRMGELQVEAYKKEFNFESLHIIRPANIYGPYLNFNPQNSMVVGSLIRRILSGENPLKVWGDGSNIRDFVYSEDVANAMLEVMEKNIQLPINIGSGNGISIKKLINILLKCKNINKNPKIVFQKTKESGDKIRVLDVNYAKRFGIVAKTSLKEGLEKTIEWYKNNKLDNRFNYFLKN